ncbi:hypothetical protein PR202_ga24473 [Eleusine coracana subsp. coracana]|uniref:Dirigent protein n=1 Tax=Eleusine coracana subsp. coracana TaxID=191504 RepID=A0AAV5D9B4_ELECO|nr:hypothetical protein QOZ80_9AG0678450 [Eleusine coracana subsp. coracana]GJN06717.1 hypothetical protein PR202_ga24473 [Eleusine coracana subsp. coracana]
MLLHFALVTSLAAALLAGIGAAAKTTTHLRLYMHDTLNVTTGLMTTGTRPVPADPRYRFGDMYAIDDPLTEGPDAASSPAVGRAQGFYIFASQTEIALFFCFNVVFTAGPHNGSTVAVLARNVFADKVRELPVVGGTGAFRGVSGYGLLSTQGYDVSSYRAVLKIDMYLSF